MSKILFVEDDLTSAETIIKLFAPVLSEEIKQRLRSTDDTEDIVALCSQNSPLDIAYSFPQALTNIIESHSDYDLILIDRNLENSPYDKELEKICSKLQGIGFSDIENRIHVFKNREGDLLLQVLLKIDSNAKNKTYFVTANVDDTLRDSRELQTMLNLDSFKRDNIIEKSSPQEERIPNMLMDMPSLKIQNEFPDQCHIIRNRLGEDWVKKFCKMIQYHRDGNKEECVLFLRMLLANKILHEIAVIMNEPKASYWKNENSKQLVVKGFIKGQEFRDYKPTWGLPSAKWKNRLGYNSVIQNACLSIAEICSDCIHGDFDDFETDISAHDVDSSVLTTYTMRTLMNQIFDVIVWYNKALDVLSKRS